MQEVEKVKLMKDISGRKCLEQYERLNPGGSWEKMFLELLVGQTDWYSKKYKMTWKLKGTKFNRYYFQLSVSGLTTSEKGYGLLPTPAAWDGKIYKVKTRSSSETIEHTKGRFKKTKWWNEKTDVLDSSCNTFLRFQKMYGQPPIFDVDDGLPFELDGITIPKWLEESNRAAGNAVVPHVVHEIFKTIETIDNSEKHQSGISAASSCINS